jgi:hypothetical protein
MSCLGLSNRVRSPSSATIVTATVNWTPRRDCKASTTGSSRPGFRLLLQFFFEPFQAFSVFGDSSPVFLEDDVLRGCGTDDFGEPAQMGRASGRSARTTDSMPQQKGFETHLCSFESPDGIFTGAAQITNGFILDGGDVDGGEIA